MISGGASVPASLNSARLWTLDSGISGSRTLVSSTAKTVTDYLDELPEDRRQLVEAVRKVINDNLPVGYEEVMNWGMITWELPLSTWPDTYNGKPLMFASLASQKNYCALYLLCSYQSEKLRARLLEGYRALGVKPNMGKSCLRFNKLGDLPLRTIGEITAAASVDKFLEDYRASRG